MTKQKCKEPIERKKSNQQKDADQTEKKKKEIRHICTRSRLVMVSSNSLLLNGLKGSTLSLRYHPCGTKRYSCNNTYVHI